METVEFIQEYNDLYDSWYMSDWPEWKKNRIKNILDELNIPDSSIVLDYGCGTGTFTRLLKEINPNWRVIGYEVSEKAAQMARLNSSNIEIYSLSNLPNVDFIFSHHVLEHVSDIDVVIQHMEDLLNVNGKMLHVLPCGNVGSLDYFVASNTKNGILEEKGNTFFYEEPLHLNRFTSQQLSNLFTKRSLQFKDSWFANHFFGCFYELTGMNTQHIRYVVNPKRASSRVAKIKFTILRTVALIFYYLQRPYTFLKLRKLNKAWTGPLLRHPDVKVKFGLLELVLFPSYVFVLFRELLERSDWWLMKKNNRASEMYLLFQK